MVGDARDDVAVGGDGREVHGGAEHARLARLHQRVAQAQIEEVAVQTGGHPGGVGVPEQDVERRGIPALQVVVDPVGPDQVVGPQPREHLGQTSPVEIAAGLRHRRGRPRGRLVEQRARDPGLRLVEDAHREPERGHPPGELPALL